ncbi:peptidase S9 [Virgisporangium ochraceum]|uniref:Peptidase S9 n=1 Tax=Virgisporangium ochraceum TaxID=65505 RepID=A0A8J3ZR72_9ACTN|nr:peptidase S9 [Virgisporangium ochraceum]
MLVQFDELSNGSWGPSPSPDGSRIAYVSDIGGSPQAYVTGPSLPPGVGGPSPWAGTLLPTGKDPVTAVHYSPDGEWIACEIAPGGAPRTELWLIRPDGTGLRQAGGFGATTILSAGWVEVRGSVQFAVTEIGELWRGLLVNPRSMARQRLTRGELVAVLDVSRDGAFAAVREGPRGRRRVRVVDLDSGVAGPLFEGTYDSSTEQAVFSPDGAWVYARTDYDSEFSRLIAVPVTGDHPVPGAEPVVVAERADAELEHVAVSRETGLLALLWNASGRSELTLFDPVTRIERWVTPPAGDVLSDPEFSRDGRTLVVCAEGPGARRSLYRVNVATAHTSPVVPRPSWSLVGAPELHHLVSGDGLALTGWFYRPAGDPPYRTMISLHPGPESQERPGHNPIYQQLAARDIAVFAPNVRGSSGYGRTFVNLDNLAGRHGAIADVAACAAYLDDAGLCSSLGVMGRSYGGYLTLAALVTHPDLFAVGVEVCGMADLLTFYEHTEPWIAAGAVSKYGDPVRDRGLLMDLSPLRRIENLATPLLIVHGASDTNVPVREAHQLVAALVRLGKPHRYVILDGEGHDFVGIDSRRRYLDEAVAWITDHLT